MEESSTLLNEDAVGSTLIIKTPKSQQIDKDVRRWASVVKAHKNILNSPEVNGFVSEKDESSEIFDCLADFISVNYENHKGFITFNKNSFFCQICSLDLDSMISLSNHLKTRKHEDNVIVFLKDQLPAHLEHTMEFVSFCKSDLCCNLCQETIEMSLNPHETLLNIIAHNTGKAHASLRANHDGHSLAHNLLNILSETHPEIRENLHFVDKKIVPHFKCKLCNKNIPYKESVELLEKHFISHFKSLGHVKNQKAVEVLKLFDDVSIPGKEKFVVMNGNILCTVCNIHVDTDVDKLILHVKGVEHASHSLADFKLFSALDAKNKDLNIEENEFSIKKSVLCNQKFEIKEIGKEPMESEVKINTDSKLMRLISTLPSNLRQVDFLIENDKGSVTCLVCDCVVPFCKQNLLIHLNGNNHQQKVAPNKVSKLKQTEDQKMCASLVRKLKVLLKSLPKDLGYVNYIVANSSGNIECLVCKCVLSLVPNKVEEHLRSLAHEKLMESQWLKKFPGYPTSSDKFIKDILKIPKVLRAYPSKSVNSAGPASIHNDYSLLLEKHSLISKNKDLLVINVDGKNCYCKMCKNLIPLSSNIGDLEKALVSHLTGKSHILHDIKNFGKKLEEVKMSPLSSSAGKVKRSLFEFLSVDEKKPSDTKMKVPDSLSSVDNLSTEPSLKTKSLETTESQERTQENDLEVFVFGKNDSNEQYNLENLKNKHTASKTSKKHKALPISRGNRTSTLELETDNVVLSRRQKQLDYGKNTEEYARYREAVSVTKRRRGDPITPPKHIKCSRRTWDGMVRVWRKNLHAWDAPKESSPLEQDIQPLPLQVC